jgi:hypothetical protein
MVHTTPFRSRYDLHQCILIFMESATFPEQQRRPTKQRKIRSTKHTLSFNFPPAKRRPHNHDDHLQEDNKLSVVLQQKVHGDVLNPKLTTVTPKPKLSDSTLHFGPFHTISGHKVIVCLPTVMVVGRPHWHLPMGTGS